MISKVAVLILNFNGKQFLGECFKSLRITEYPCYEVYLVDNGSSDNSVEYVQENFPWVKIIKHRKNYGFCEGYNKAIRQIDAKYVMLLNNDIKVLKKDWLINLVEVLEGDDKIAAVGAKLIFANFPSIINSVGGRLYRWSGAADIGARESDFGQYDRPPIEPFYNCGGAMLLRRDIFLSVGGFDSKMFAYSEDLDLCWRFRLAGFRIVYCPKVTIHHIFSASWHSYGLYKMYLSNRNLIRAMGKNYSLSSLCKNAPLFILNGLVQTMLFSLVFRKTLAFYFNLKALAWNIANLPSTMKERYKIQTSRKTPENAVLTAMGQEKFEKVTEILRKIRFDRKYSGMR